MSSKRSVFIEYINNFTCSKGNQYTHTRIGNKELGIMGGSYNISE